MKAGEAKPIKAPNPPVAIAFDPTRPSLGADHEAAEDIRVERQHQIRGGVSRLLDQRVQDTRCNGEQIVRSGGGQPGFAGERIDQQHAAVCLERVAWISLCDAAERGAGQPYRLVVGGAAIHRQGPEMGQARRASTRRPRVSMLSA